MLSMLFSLQPTYWQNLFNNLSDFYHGVRCVGQVFVLPPVSSTERSGVHHNGGPLQDICRSHNLPLSGGASSPSGPAQQIQRSYRCHCKDMEVCKSLTRSSQHESSVSKFINLDGFCFAGMKASLVSTKASCPTWSASLLPAASPSWSTRTSLAFFSGRNKRGWPPERTKAAQTFNWNWLAGATWTLHWSWTLSAKMRRLWWIEQQWGIVGVISAFYCEIRGESASERQEGHLFRFGEVVPIKVALEVWVDGTQTFTMMKMYCVFQNTKVLFTWFPCKTAVTYLNPDHQRLLRWFWSARHPLLLMKWYALFQKHFSQTFVLILTILFDDENIKNGFLSYFKCICGIYSCFCKKWVQVPMTNFFC